jgi:hypothetical protein
MDQTIYRKFEDPSVNLNQGTGVRIETRDNIIARIPSSRTCPVGGHDMLHESKIVFWTHSMPSFLVNPNKALRESMRTM